MSNDRGMKTAGQGTRAVNKWAASNANNRMRGWQSKSLSFRLALTTVLILVMAALPGCAPNSGLAAATAAPVSPSNDAGQAPGSIAPTAQIPETPTPQDPTPTAPSFTPTPVTPKVWLSPALPAAFLEQVSFPSGWQTVKTREEAKLFVEIPSQLAAPGGEVSSQQASWVFAVVAPFPTLPDSISLDAIRRAWGGDLSAAPGGKPLLVSPETKAFLDMAWHDPRQPGPANQQGIQVVEKAALLEAAWKDQPAWAIIPFEDIEPRWKVLKVDGISPLDQAYGEAAIYPLDFPITVLAEPGAERFIPPDLALPTNRDPQKLTSLVLTGVTALSRYIGMKMESEGLTYPARDIRGWLADADLTHISNEVSFYSECPKPGPERLDMRFCSHPKYIALLEDVGADIIELTGNHIIDWGYQPFLDSLEMYRARGWQWYGGGANLEEATRPLLVEHHGNRLAFTGCSPAGPESVWATRDQPGSAPCDFFKLEQQIRDLRAQGYLPVVTLQHHETDGYLPSPASGGPDFRRMAAAGAVIVSGSQSHYAQTMTLVMAENGQANFVHYGLGNLFFDQMKPDEIRAQFIDRHIFYNGKYLGVELLTAKLEESARPRPMTPTERETFLTTIFALSDWHGN